MIVGSLAAGEASKSPDGVTLSSLTLTLLVLTALRYYIVTNSNSVAKSALFHELSLI